MKVFFDGYDITGSKEITSKLLKLPPTVSFWTHQKVNDELRGYIIKIDCKWAFISPLKYLILRNGHYSELKKIALILESPHKDEYDFDEMPLRPANGETGRNIQNHLVKKLIDENFNFDDNTDYAVLLINPVQYQASCYHQFSAQGLQSDKNLKNKVFRRLFDYLKTDFQYRIKSYNPDYIINACTGGVKGVLQQTVTNALDSEFKNKVCLNLTHPSDWI